MSFVNYKDENGIGIVSINRPEALNAINSEIIAELDGLIKDEFTSESLRAVVFYGDKNFAAGADVKSMVDCDEESIRDFSFSPVFNKLQELEIPTIAAIEGFALGGGMELALTADIRVCGESAKMGFPEITLGIIPGAGGTIRTPKIISPAIAKELIFTGNLIDANRAYQIGLVNKVVEDGEALNEAIALASKIASRAPIAVKAAKKTVNAGLGKSNIIEGIEIEAENFAKLFNTEDQKEGMRALLEKRKPVFKNR